MTEREYFELVIKRDLRSHWNSAIYADDILDAVVIALRKYFPEKSRHDLELMLGDVRLDVVHDLTQLTDEFAEAVAEIVSDALSDDEE
jgi:hypothetical protein